MRSRFVSSVVAALLSTGLACVVVRGDGGDAAGETTMIGETGDGDGDPGDGDGDGDGDPDCPPGDPDVYFSYEPFEFGIDPWDIDLDWTCTVTEADLGEGLRLLLDCPEAAMPITIDISATPSFLPPVIPGDTIHVRYVYEGPWWFNIYLRLDVDGQGHLLTMIDGDSLLPPDNFAFEPPFPIEAVSGLCTPAPDVCGNAERLALAFTVNGEAVEMLDSSYAIVGGVPGTEVWVATAERLHDINCTDTPDEWYRVLIASAPSP
jgi:hypothetical protein